MATTAIWSVKYSLRKVLDYVMNKDKTEKQLYVSGINVQVENACEEMTLTKQSWNKEKGILAFHGYQSFAPNEVNKKQAHEIGVELANTLWGDRFEVIVTTHLDKEHIHNHFVVNSVSFKDGLRYYDNKKSYKEMRSQSDAICNKYSLSVIEKPKEKAYHYAEWKAQVNNKPTIRSSIRNDVDDAIANSRTFTQFIQRLKKDGYVIKTGTKYMSIKPLNSTRYIRLKSLSKDGSYEVDNIKQRILENSIVKLEPIQEKAIIKYKGDLKKAKKLTGFKALYFHYMYNMGILPKHASSQKRVHVLLKEDLKYIDTITKEATLLWKKNIQTLDQLTCNENTTLEKIAELKKKRNSLNNKERRCNDDELKEIIKQEAKDISKEIRNCRKEVMLYEGVKKRSLRFKENLNEIQKEKEEKNHASRRRECRSSSKDESTRD